MADSILSSLLSRAALSIVNDVSGKDVAGSINVKKVEVRYGAKPMRHMKEDGSSVVDTKVIEPVVVSLDVICGTIDQMNVVNDLLKDRTSTYTVTTKGLVINLMMADDFSVNQSPDMLSANPVRLTFKQLIRQSVISTPVVEQQADASVFERGIQSAKAVTFPVTNAFQNVIPTALPPLQ